MRPVRRAGAAVAVLVAGVVGASACGERAPSIPSAATEVGTSAVAAPPTTGGTSATPERMRLQVLGEVSHDTGAFTQGLAFDEAGRLYESTGRYGRSSVRRLDPSTGAVLRRRDLPDDRFGEGLAVGPDGLVQLTWKEGDVYRWSLEDLEPLPSWSIVGEGWGLAWDPSGQRYLRSDGSSNITVHAALDFSVTGRIEVTREGTPVDELNELEVVDGVLWANVWHSDELLRVDASTGEVTGVVDASGLWDDPGRGPEQVLNGIAHRPGDPPDVLWVGGKEWPTLFRVRVVPA